MRRLVSWYVLTGVADVFATSEIGLCCFFSHWHQLPNVKESCNCKDSVRSQVKPEFKIKIFMGFEDKPSNWKIASN
jgi:hypothetical protein